MPALRLFVLFTVATLLFVAVAALVFEWLGNRAVEIRLFFGRQIFEVTYRGRKFSLGYLPFGGFVKPERAPFIDWDFGRSSLPPLASVGVLVAVAVACLGPDRAWAELISGVQQFVQGSFSPLAVGKLHCGDISEFMKKAPLPLAFGMVAIKITAVNVVPVPTGPLGAIFWHGLGKLLRIPTRAMEYLQLVAALAMFLALGCWIVALVAYLASGAPAA